jgi:hypothetical protein
LLHSYCLHFNIVFCMVGGIQPEYIINYKDRAVGRVS